jgi:RNA polymerase nonessential primary-like sigma factor
MLPRQPISDRQDTFLRDVIEDPLCLTPAETTEGVMRRAETHGLGERAA